MITLVQRGRRKGRTVEIISPGLEHACGGIAHEGEGTLGRLRTRARRVRRRGGDRVGARVHGGDGVGGVVVVGEEVKGQIGGHHVKIDCSSHAARVKRDPDTGKATQVRKMCGRLGRQGAAGDAAKREWAMRGGATRASRWSEWEGERRKGGREGGKKRWMGGCAEVDAVDGKSRQSAHAHTVEK